MGSSRGDGVLATVTDGGVITCGAEDSDGLVLDAGVSDGVGLVLSLFAGDFDLDVEVVGLGVLGRGLDWGGVFVADDGATLGGGVSARLAGFFRTSLFSLRFCVQSFDHLLARLPELPCCL